MNKGFIKLGLLFAGVLALVGVAGYLVSARNVDAGQENNHQENNQGVPCQTYLQYKDRDWNEIGRQASRLHYGINRIEFEARDLIPDTDYTLIEYPEPQTTWPWPIVRIAHGVSTNGGTLELSADYQLKVGYKYWLVLTSDLVDDTISGWQPSKYLFEHELIPENECTVEPSPTPSPEPTVTPTPEPTPTPEDKTSVCTDEEALNYGGEDGVFDEDKEVSDNELCEYEQVTPTPTPEPEVRVEQGPPGTPQCTDSTPLVLPSNVHVVRAGADATVNFFTDSKNANIYFRTSGTTRWEHSLRDIPVTNGYVSVTIHDLNPTGDYDFGVESANSCAGSGNVLLAVVIDDWSSRTFGLSGYEWLR